MKQYESGVLRNVDDDKPDYTLVDEPMLTRWAQHMSNGAKTHGRRNWQKACTADDLLRFRASAFRHFIQWLRGDTDEDHAAALFFNVSGAEMVKTKLDTTCRWYPKDFAEPFIVEDPDRPWTCPGSWGTVSDCESDIPRPFTFEDWLRTNRIKEVFGPS